MCGCHTIKQSLMVNAAHHVLANIIKYALWTGKPLKYKRKKCQLLLQWNSSPTHNTKAENLKKEWYLFIDYCVFPFVKVIKESSFLNVTTFKGLGGVTTEFIDVDENGKMMNCSPVSYMIPNVRSIPRKFNVTLVQEDKIVTPVYSAKVWFKFIKLCSCLYAAMLYHFQLCVYFTEFQYSDLCVFALGTERLSCGLKLN